MTNVPAEDISYLKANVDQMKQLQEEQDTRISDVKKGIYDPDNGLYARNKELKTWADNHEKKDDERHEEFKQWTKEHDEKDKEFRKRVDDMSKFMEPIVLDFGQRQKRRKWTDKIWLFVIISLLGFLGAYAKQIFIENPKKIDEIEEHIKRQQNKDGIKDYNNRRTVNQ